MTFSALRVAIIVFPGSNCDRDMMVAIEQLTSRRPALVWHKETIWMLLTLLLFRVDFLLVTICAAARLQGDLPL